MPWTSTGEEWRNPWLPLADTSRNVETQRNDPASTLSFVRELIAWRRGIGDGPYRSLPSDRGVWRYERGDATCVVDFRTWGTAIV